MLRFVLSLSLILLLLQSSRSASVADAEAEAGIPRDTMSLVNDEKNAKDLSDIQLMAARSSDQCRSNVVDYPSTCAEATALSRKSGIYTIQEPVFSDQPFLAYCNEDEQGGGWMAMQRRVDDTIDFYRNWTEYEIGFGNLATNFFLGLKKIHAMTTAKPHELLIVMTDFDNVRKYAKYDAFAIGDSSENYALKLLGQYNGDAGDSLTYHQGQMWSTKDRKNDNHTKNCAVEYKGAWWYKSCHISNLNGLYLNGEYEKAKYAQGITWKVWRGNNYSLKTVNMLIRPKRS